jgi:hypothetical protein
MSVPTEFIGRPALGRRRRQKKIAILTSGGDSAGMNAAGMSIALLDTPGLALTFFSSCCCPTGYRSVSRLLWVRRNVREHGQ